MSSSKKDSGEFLPIKIQQKGFLTMKKKENCDPRIDQKIGLGHVEGLIGSSFSIGVDDRVNQESMFY